MTDSAAARLTLAVGDRVVYPNQGVCRVTAVESKDIAGQRLVFVTLKREEDNAVVMVPEAKVVSIGLRKVGDANEVEGIFEFLRSDSDKANLDWKQRARANVERMSQGGLMGLAEVVKGLQVLSELRPLPAKERELYDNARHLLVEEIAASLKIDPADAEDSVDVILFPPGRERPKRTAEEFRNLNLADLSAGEEGDLDLDDPLLAVADELDLPDDEAPPAEDDTEVEGKAVESEDTPTKPAAKRGRPRKKPLETVSPPDDEVTEPEAQAAPAPKKRGRPPKPKPPESDLPKVPKKRGRPPKAKPPEQKSKAAPVAPPAKWAKAATKVPNTGKKR